MWFVACVTEVNLDTLQGSSSLISETDSVLVWVLPLLQNIMTRSKFVEKSLFGLCFYIHGLPLKEVKTRTQTDRNLQAGVDAEFMEGYFLLVCSLWLTHSDLLCNLTHNSLAPPSSITN